MMKKMLIKKKAPVEDGIVGILRSVNVMYMFV